MNAALVIRFVIAMWVSFVLANLSFVAMGIELRRRGVPIKWLSYSLNLKVRFAKVAEVTRAYWEFKNGRQEVPLFACAMGLFGATILAIPLVGLLCFVLS